MHLFAKPREDTWIYWLTKSVMIQWMIQYKKLINLPVAWRFWRIKKSVRVICAVICNNKNKIIYEASSLHYVTLHLRALFCMSSLSTASCGFNFNDSTVLNIKIMKLLWGLRWQMKPYATEIQSSAVQMTVEMLQMTGDPTDDCCRWLLQMTVFSYALRVC